MSNFHPVNYDQASPELQSVYQDICTTMELDSPPTWATYLGRAPHLVNGMWAMLKQVVINNHLPPLLKELVFFAVAYHRTVPYCMDLHAQNIFRMTSHLSYHDLLDIVEGNSQGLIPSTYQVAIDLAVKLCKCKCSLNETDFSQLEKVGFDEVEAMEISTLVSAAIYFNVLTFAANLPVPKTSKRTRWQ